MVVNELADEQITVGLTVQAENVDDLNKVTAGLRNVANVAESSGRNMSRGSTNIRNFINGFSDINNQLNQASRRLRHSLDGFHNVWVSGLRTTVGEVKNLTQDAINSYTELTRAQAKVTGAMAPDYNLKSTSGKERFKYDADRLKQQSIELSRTGTTGSGSFYNASQVASAQEALVKAGVKPKDILGKNILKDVLTFAQANDLDINTSVNFATALGSQFKVKKENWGEMLDKVSHSADLSIIDVKDVVESMKYAGGITAGLNRPIDEVLAMITSLGQFGLKGSQAGSGIQALYTRLLTQDTTVFSDKQREVSPPKAVKAFYDFSKYAKSDGSGLTYSQIKKANDYSSLGKLSGNLRPMDEIVEELDKAMGELNDEEQAWFAKKFFGLYQMKGAYALINGDDSELKKYEKDIKENSAGTNDIKLQELLDGDYGKQQSLEKMIEATKTDVGGRLSPLVNNVREQLYGILEDPDNYEFDFDELKDTLHESSDKIAEQYGTQIGNFVNDIGNGAIDIARVGGELAPDVGSGVMDILVAIGNLDIGGIFSAWSRMTDNMEDSVNGLPDELRDLGNAVSGVIQAFGILMGIDVGSRIIEFLTSAIKGIVAITQMVVRAGTVIIQSGVDKNINKAYDNARPTWTETETMRTQKDNHGGKTVTKTVRHQDLRTGETTVTTKQSKTSPEVRTTKTTETKSVSSDTTSHTRPVTTVNNQKVDDNRPKNKQGVKKQRKADGSDSPIGNIDYVRSPNGEHIPVTGTVISRAEEREILNKAMADSEAKSKQALLDSKKTANKPDNIDMPAPIINDTFKNDSKSRKVIRDDSYQYKGDPERWYNLTDNDDLANKIAEFEDKKANDKSKLADINKRMDALDKEYFPNATNDELKKYRDAVSHGNHLNNIPSEWSIGYNKYLKDSYNTDTENKYNSMIGEMRKKMRDNGLTSDEIDEKVKGVMDKKNAPDTIDIVKDINPKYGAVGSNSDVTNIERTITEDKPKEKKKTKRVMRFNEDGTRQVVEVPDTTKIIPDPIGEAHNEINRISQEYNEKKKLYKHTYGKDGEEVNGDEYAKEYNRRRREIFDPLDESYDYAMKHGKDISEIDELYDEAWDELDNGMKEWRTEQISRLDTWKQEQLSGIGRDNDGDTDEQKLQNKYKRQYVEARDTKKMASFREQFTSEYNKMNGIDSSAGDNGHIDIDKIVRERNKITDGDKNKIDELYKSHNLNDKDIDIIEEYRNKSIKLEKTTDRNSTNVTQDNITARKNVDAIKKSAQEALDESHKSIPKIADAMADATSGIVGEMAEGTAESITDNTIEATVDNNGVIHNAQNGELYGNGSRINPDGTETPLRKSDERTDKTKTSTRTTETTTRARDTESETSTNTRRRDNSGIVDERAIERSTELRNIGMLGGILGAASAGYGIYNLYRAEESDTWQDHDDYMTQGVVNMAAPGIGAGIGAIIGSIIPIVGTATGAGAGAGIGGLSSLLFSDGLADSINDWIDGSAKIEDALESSISAHANYEQSLRKTDKFDELKKKYEQIRDKMDGTVEGSDKYIKYQGQLRDVLAEMNELYPGYIASNSNNLDTIDKSIDATSRMVEMEQKLADIRNAQAVTKLAESAPEMINQYNKSKQYRNQAEKESASAVDNFNNITALHKMIESGAISAGFGKDGFKINFGDDVDWSQFGLDGIKNKKDVKDWLRKVSKDNGFGDGKNTATGKYYGFKSTTDDNAWIKRMWEGLTGYKYYDRGIAGKEEVEGRYDEDRRIDKDAPLQQLYTGAYEEIMVEAQEKLLNANNDVTQKELTYQQSMNEAIATLEDMVGSDGSIRDKTGYELAGMSLSKLIKEGKKTDMNLNYDEAQKSVAKLEQLLGKDIDGNGGINVFQGKHADEYIQQYVAKLTDEMLQSVEEFKGVRKKIKELGIDDKELEKNIKGGKKNKKSDMEVLRDYLNKTNTTKMREVEKDALSKKKDGKVPESNESYMSQINSGISDIVNSVNNMSIVDESKVTITPTTTPVTVQPIINLTANIDKDGNVTLSKSQMNALFNMHTEWNINKSRQYSKKK